ncbi:MAG: tRNA (5-methylaminomethyl-2-thiouridine)(34)-methyltransferase MnmD [Dysgonamonadaceae bacterium]|jgi:tRNA U34 5-methylaminomethyl-2-thiouridine-forming methyltransferase MnmC|nr:tRNA (5-methylaminomethyl-2-thiouridine)(34)-methyltransferase MnmD [Dysgonamonadaceae bacterium]
MKPEIQITADGSPTLFVPEMDEHYHSVNGAGSESRHVFINAGFLELAKEKETGNRINILELGFGTGLNAMLTALEAETCGLKVNYSGLEKFPLPEEIYSKLDFGAENRSLFLKLHRAEWEKPVKISENFVLNKVCCDFNDFRFPEKYDLVYYDAFAPDKQPEVWQQTLFDAIFKSMNRGGILTTYCAKGAVRRGFVQAGFAVERIPGPAGKREMLRCRVQ